MIGQNEKHLYYYDHLDNQQDLDKDKHLKLPKNREHKESQRDKTSVMASF